MNLVKTDQKVKKKKKKLKKTNAYTPSPMVIAQACCFLLRDLLVDI